MSKEDVILGIPENLKIKIMDCVNLSDVSYERLQSTNSIVTRHVSELIDRKFENSTELNDAISTLVNRVLSTVEALGVPEAQYKAMRKLILNEIYGCKTLLEQELKK